MKKAKEKYPAGMRKHEAKEMKLYKELESEGHRMQKKMGSKKAARSKKSGY